MLKFIGAVIIVLTSVLLFSRKVLESYFTYMFLKKSEDYITKLMLELGTNLPYKKIMENIAFDKDRFFRDAGKNRFVISEEYFKIKKG